MLPSALHNRCRIWINGEELVEPTDISVSQPKPIGGKFGPKGLIGIFRGQALCRIDLTFAQVADKSQVEAFALAQENEETGFVLVFTKGVSKFMSQFCYSGDASMRNTYESGDTTVSLALVGSPVKQIA